MRVAIMLVAALLAGFGASVPLSAQTPAEPRLNAKSVDLREMLEKGLKARRPEEFAYIQRVVDQVEAGTLPVDLVRGTFDWARRKRPYPYPFFERALAIRAARLGITVQ